MTAKPHNGHRSWNAWNVSLWINNDEGLYRLAVECVEQAKRKTGDKRKALTCATRAMMQYVAGDKTPDGGRYNALCVREAIRYLF